MWIYTLTACLVPDGVESVPWMDRSLPRPCEKARKRTHRPHSGKPEWMNDHGRRTGDRHSAAASAPGWASPGRVTARVRDGPAWDGRAGLGRFSSCRYLQSARGSSGRRDGGWCPGPFAGLLRRAIFDRMRPADQCDQTLLKRGFLIDPPLVVHLAQQALHRGRVQSRGSGEGLARSDELRFLQFNHLPIELARPASGAAGLAQKGNPQLQPSRVVKSGQINDPALQFYPICLR